MTSPTSCLTPEKGKVPSAAFTASPRRGGGLGRIGVGGQTSPPHPPVPRQTFRMGGEAQVRRQGRRKAKGSISPRG